MDAEPLSTGRFRSSGVDARRLVKSSFSQPQRCYGHCDKQANLRFLDTGEPALACYVCPAGYVSKVMAYGKSDARGALSAFLTKALGQHVGEGAIRSATRHPWELGVRGFEMKVAYWTQNYRGSKSDDPNRRALFVCSECGSAYVKPLTGPGTKCEGCRA